MEFVKDQSMLFFDSNNYQYENPDLFEPSAMPFDIESSICYYKQEPELLRKGYEN